MDFADFGEADSATPNVIKRHYASPAVDAAEKPEGAISQLVDEAKKSGDPGAIRTRDPQLRRLVLYPAELPGHDQRGGLRHGLGTGTASRLAGIAPKNGGA